jgi:hypothetical protein
MIRTFSFSDITTGKRHTPGQTRVSYIIQHTTDLPDPGNQASRSSFLAAAWLRAPDTMLTIRYGIRSAW